MVSPPSIDPTTRGSPSLHRRCQPDGEAPPGLLPWLAHVLRLIERLNNASRVRAGGRALDSDTTGRETLPRPARRRDAPTLAASEWPRLESKCDLASLGRHFSLNCSMHAWEPGLFMPGGEVAFWRALSDCSSDSSAGQDRRNPGGSARGERRLPARPSPRTQTERRGGAGPVGSYLAARAPPAAFRKSDQAVWSTEICGTRRWGPSTA
jgi:hypothetical protein